MKYFVVSGSPHVHQKDNVSSLMRGVIYAMVPAMLVSIYMFGLGAIRVFLVSIIACLAIEYLIQKFLLKKDTVTITDGSAMVTAILLAFNVPSSIPSWMLIMGALVSIGIAKMSFGGLGQNPFNPAIVGRIFMLISFPVDMTTWPKPIVSRGYFSFSGLDKAMIDSMTGATNLGVLKEQGFSAVTEYVNPFMGQVGGSLGEVSALALMIGGIYMIYKKIITWHIPVSVMASSILLSGALWIYDPVQYADPVFHLVTGGLMLGIFFMATDYVTSPVSKKGQLIFGTGIGLLTILIRAFGAYPEGVSFAILIMNAFTPIINMYFKPKRFGH